jgi:hypothetical protein
VFFQQVISRQLYQTSGDTTLRWVYRSCVYEGCRNNVNSPVRASAIGLLQHLQLLYLPSELDITKYTKRVYPTFDCNQTPDPVIPTREVFFLPVGTM